MRYCKKCNLNKNIEEHHVHPKFMDNPKGFGRLLDLCKKCHRILHFIIPAIIWKYVPKRNRLKVIKEIESFSLKEYCLKDKNKKIKDFDNKEKNRCDDCDYELDAEDFIDRMCPYCFSSIKESDSDDKHN